MILSLRSACCCASLRGLISPLVPVLYQTAHTLCGAAHYCVTLAPPRQRCTTCRLLPRCRVVPSRSSAALTGHWWYHNASAVRAKCSIVRCSMHDLHWASKVGHLPSHCTTPNRLPAEIPASTNWELMKLFMWPVLPATANTQPREEKPRAPVPLPEPHTNPAEEKPGAAALHTSRYIAAAPWGQWRGYIHAPTISNTDNSSTLEGRAEQHNQQQQHRQDNSRAPVGLWGYLDGATGDWCCCLRCSPCSKVGG